MIATKTFIDNTSIEKYRDEFESTHCVFIPGFLSGNTLENILRKLQTATFQTKFETDNTNKLGKVLFIPLSDPVVFTFWLLLNNPELFSMLQEITQCGHIGNFVGRIHRSEGGEDHSIEWHSDNTDNRLLAITLCLGTDDYTGGKLQIKSKDDENIIREFGQLTAGDAIIFKISPHLKHRLTNLETGRRTVGIGWFRSEPDFDTFAAMHLKPF
ncbi:MAG: 2OG-Fe(II) oxygenase [Bacteroidetes bacterium]|jgi:hypothetical protein|nr:2OG-Fe(II) oxygenase [Bacteroidota bacterium]